SEADLKFIRACTLRSFPRKRESRGRARFVIWVPATGSPRRKRRGVPLAGTSGPFPTARLANFGLGLVEPRARAPDDLTPLAPIPPDQFGEFVRRAARGLVADHGEAVLERLRCDRLVDRRVELIDDRPRYAGGRDDAAPGRRRVTGNAGFRDRRQVRKARRAPRPADR